MTIKEARWFVEQDVWRSIQEYRAFNNITKANILQQALNTIWCQIENGRLDVTYRSMGNGGDDYSAGHKSTKINYCPMCGRKLEVEG